jgi:copper(I)-binding protein
MNIKPLLTLVLILALLLVPSLTLAQADEDSCSIVSLFDGWARATPEGAPTGAVFGLLVNLTDAPDTLVAARTDAAEVVELHEMRMGEGDVMQMRPVEGGFVVEPHNYLELRPGGLHIMLIGLRQPLQAGSTLDLVLEFEQAGAVAVTVPIRQMDAESAMTMQPEMMPPVKGPASEWGEACAKMHVLGAWARPAAAAMPNSAVYALLLNLTASDDVLTSADAEVSQVVELHEMVMEAGDVMRMRPIEGGIPVPAGGTAFLRPGGLHVMLIGLTQPLEAGTMLDLTLSFAESGDIVLRVPVREPMEGGMSGMSMGG